jgi:hypothetical protein
MKTHYLKRLIGAALLLCLFCSHLNAQETLSDFLKNTTISGFADVYYKYDFNKTGQNTKTSFTVPHNSIEPAMFSLKFVNTTGKFSATADLGYGKRVEAYNYNESDTNLIIKQLFIDYNATEKLKFTAGSWETHIGYELLDSPANDTYSMSYAFSYGPFFHTGLKANYTEGAFNFMSGLANPTDFKSSFEKVPVYDSSGNLTKISNLHNKYFIWQVGYTKDALTLYINGQQGSNNPLDSNVSQFDFVGTYQTTDKLKFGANATLVNINYDSNSTKENWYSLVAYAKYNVTDGFALNYRAEYLNNKDNALSLGQIVGNTVFANTISATLSKDNFQLKPELRFENSSEKIYQATDGNPKNNDANILLAAIYKF